MAYAALSRQLSPGLDWVPVSSLIFCQIWISFKTMTLCLISALLRPKSFQSEVEVSNLLITIFGENYQFFITMNFLLA